MPNKSPNQSMFANFGLSPETREEYQARRNNQEYDVLARQHNQANPAYGGLGSASGFATTLGMSVANSFISRSRGKLTPMEQKQFDTTDEARNSYDQAVEDGLLKGKGQDERSLYFQNILAQSAYNNGLPGVGAQVDADLIDKRGKWEQQEKQRARLDQQITMGESNQALKDAQVLDEAQFGTKNRQDKRTQAAQQLEQGKTANEQGKYNLANSQMIQIRLPGSTDMINARRNPHTGSAFVGEMEYKAGEFYTDDAVATTAKSAARAGPAEGRDIRTQVSGLVDERQHQIRIVEHARRVNEAFDPDLAQGKTGKLMSGLSNVKNIVGDLFNETGLGSDHKGEVILSGGFDMVYDAAAPVKSAQKLMKNKKIKTQVDKMMEGLDLKGAHASAFRAHHLAAAYASASAVENGKLSDDDIVRHLKINGGDAETFAAYSLIQGGRHDNASDRLDTLLRQGKDIVTPETLEKAAAVFDKSEEYFHPERWQAKQDAKNTKTVVNKDEDPVVVPDTGVEAAEVKEQAQVVQQRNSEINELRARAGLPPL